MAVISELQTASFRNVTFLFRDEIKDGGKKIVSHEYPFSNRRFTEELGELPPVFRMDIIIFGSIQNRLDFERVLTLPGLGQLVHPVYGTIDVKATTYSVSSNQTKIGEFKFSVNFQASEQNITASPITVTRETVAQNAADVRLAANSAFHGRYFDPDTALETSKIRTKVTDAVSILSGVVDTLTNPNETKKVLFNRQANNILNNAGAYVQSASIAVTELSTLMNYALDVADSPDRLLTQWVQLAGYGYINNPFDFTIGGQDRGTNVGKTNTVKRLHTETNRQLMNEYIRVNALANAYESASYADFVLDEELENTMSFLADAYRLQFKDFYEVDQDLELLANDPDVRDRMLILRSNAVATYNEKIQNVWRVVDIDPGQSSMSLISYRYYGSIDNVDLIIGLNPAAKTSYVMNEIKAITK